MCPITHYQLMYNTHCDTHRYNVLVLHKYLKEQSFYMTDGIVSIMKMYP